MFTGRFLNPNQKCSNNMFEGKLYLPNLVSDETSACRQSFLNLNKEVKMNLTKIGINELHISPIAKTNFFGLVTIILSLSFGLFFPRFSKIKCQESLEIFRY